ncbi:MAG: hypothetical protein ABI867_02860 [Kofleriaceae bacterium]
MRNLFLGAVLLIGCVDGDELDYEEVDEAVATPPCSSGQWCIEPAPIASTITLRGVWAASANDVFVVGDAGTVLRRTNNTWTTIASGTTNMLKAVWGTSATNVWVVGQAGTVKRWDGSAWTSITVTTSNVDAIWGSSATDIWLAGPSTVWHSTNAGTSWTTSALSGALFSISGTGPGDVWVTGENAYLRHWANNRWTTVNPGAGTSTYFTVLALATNSVWTTDFFPNKETLRYNGSSWIAAKTSSAIFQDLHATTASDIWGVGASKIGRWNGSVWTVSSPVGSNASLWSVTGVPGQLWAVGSSALIAHYVY